MPSSGWTTDIMLKDASQLERKSMQHHSTGIMRGTRHIIPYCSHSLTVSVGAIFEHDLKELLILHCVSKKDTTQPPTIISTIVVGFQ